jgi:hypothetical protein
MKKYLYYITTGIIAIAVGLMGGIMDIVQPQNVIDMASHLGYPLYFFTLLGIFKVLGGTALVLPKRFDRLKDVAYLGFSFDFIFASYSHFSVGDPIVKVLVPLVFLGILYISFRLKEVLTY